MEGIIFQKGHAFGTALDPEIGIRARIQEFLNYGVFHSIIFSTPDADLSKVCGEMQDKWGSSEITEFQLNENHLQFVKTYKNRPAGIQYHFSKGENDLWIGRYTGIQTGKGTAKLYLREITADFFQPPA